METSSNFVAEENSDDVFFLSFSSGTIKMIFAWIFHIPRFLSRFFLFFLKIYLDLQLRSYNFDFSRIKFKGYSLGLIVCSLKSLYRA